MARKEIVPRRDSGKAVAPRREWAYPFETFRKEMDRLVEDFFGGFDMPFAGRRTEGFLPHIDVVDTDKEIKVSAELPGMDEKDVEVSLTKEALSIRGEKKEEKEEKGKDYYRSERFYGSFSRTVPLPVQIDTGKVVATFKKGVLTVRLPKSKQTIEETKKVAVKAE
jgi:HSP20 family protein